jgi:hypothetical protein
MTFNRIASLFALLAVICVLALFFCHSIQGPYSAVHGPVTALLSVRAASGVRLAIVHTASNLPHLSFELPLAHVDLFTATTTSLESPSSSTSPDLTLRC